MESEFNTLSSLSLEIHDLLRDLEKFRSTDIMDSILVKCWKARRVSDRRYGNVIEQIGRVEAGVKVARKSGSLDELHSAVTRVRMALDIHERASGSSSLT